MACHAAVKRKPPHISRRAFRFFKGPCPPAYAPSCLNSRSAPPLLLHRTGAWSRRTGVTGAYSKCAGTRTGPKLQRASLIMWSRSLTCECDEVFAPGSRAGAPAHVILVCRRLLGGAVARRACLAAFKLLLPAFLPLLPAAAEVESVRCELAAIATYAERGGVSEQAEEGGGALGYCADGEWMPTEKQGICTLTLGATGRRCGGCLLLTESDSSCCLAALAPARGHWLLAGRLRLFYRSLRSCKVSMSE
jgi:hypothetical protein